MTANTVYYRGQPKVEVLHGFWGNENVYQTLALPVDSTNPLIYSGQVVYASTSGTWLLATATAAKGQLCYIAMEDSTDSDVRSANKLLALSFSNVATIQTPFVDWTQVYVRNTVLELSATPGLLTATTATAGNGFIQNPSVDVFGVVTAGTIDFNIGGPGNMDGSLSGLVANSGINSESLPIGAGDGYIYAGQSIATNSAYVGKIPMVQFLMKWSPARDVTNAVS